MWAGVEFMMSLLDGPIRQLAVMTIGTKRVVLGHFSLTLNNLFKF